MSRALLLAAVLLAGLAGLLVGRTTGPETSASDDGPSRIGSVEADPAEVTGARPAVIETTTTASSSTTTVEPAPAVAPGNVRTYALDGGVVVLAYDQDGTPSIELVSAEPATGFTADSTVDDAGVLEVNFRQGSRHSQLRAWIAGGRQVVLDDH